ncbi:MAG: hypothetical protein AB7F74_11600 [Parvibaculaceae bacterium]
MILDHLALAERHVAQGRQHIAQQKQIIIALESGGHDTTEAKRLLLNFEDVQKMHLADRDRLKKELADWV